jgi:hypothetical protein
VDRTNRCVVLSPADTPLTLATNWLEQCSQSHLSCLSQNPEHRPTRLVHIRGGDTKVVLTDTWESMPQYATLSYCWGAGDFQKLTSDNILAFMNAVPSAALPETYMCAFEICRKLNIQYIWIDALCILQDKDNRQDWLRESGRMKFVYGGSYVNIAAASAVSAHRGSLSKIPGYSGGCYARIEDDRRSRVLAFHSDSVYGESTTDTALADRAWVLQERLLAPRTLYFGDCGLFWECRTTVMSEFLPCGIPDNLMNPLIRPETKSWPWRDIVELYSSAKLTNGTDKLPALSGIAQRQHEITGDEYVAGMWKKRLVKQLGWRCSEAKARPDWRAPTWSWISVDGKVYYWGYWDSDELATDEFVDIISAETAQSGPDRFGPIDHGNLHLACTSILQGQMYNDPSSIETSSYSSEVAPGNIAITIGKQVYYFPFIKDCSEGDSLQDNCVIYLLPLFGGLSGSSRSRPRQSATPKEAAIREGSQSLEPCDSHESHEGSGECNSPEGSEDSEDLEWIEDSIISGLVLHRSEVGHGWFRRIGSFSYTDGFGGLLDSEGSRYYHDFKQAINDAGVSTAESLCLGVQPKPGNCQAKYVIRIV